MNRTLTVLILSGVVLSGCATVRDSRVNPFNWFDSSTPAPVNVDPEATGAVHPTATTRHDVSVVDGALVIFQGLASTPCFSRSVVRYVV